MTVPAYMQACLMNPEYGYYAGKHGLCLLYTSDAADE